jgi:hypothetical protein
VAVAARRVTGTTTQAAVLLVEALQVEPNLCGIQMQD